MARSIGLDIGNRRIGVAFSDTLKVIARPVEIIDRRQQDPLARITVHVREQQADEVIVGYPWNSDGTAGDQARRVEQFAEALRARIGVPVRFYDERHSTSEAREILGTRKRQGESAHDDAIAAAVILQRYLDDRRANFTSQEGDDRGYVDDEDNYA